MFNYYYEHDMGISSHMRSSSDIDNDDAIIGTDVMPPYSYQTPPSFLFSFIFFFVSKRHEKGGNYWARRQHDDNFFSLLESSWRALMDPYLKFVQHHQSVLATCLHRQID